MAIENVEEQINELSLDETTSESTGTTISNDDSSFYYDYNDDDSDSLSAISDIDLITSLSIRSPPKYTVL